MTSFRLPPRPDRGADAGEMDWPALVAAIERNDAESMGVLYTLLRQSLRFVLFRQLPSEDIEDRISDVFLAVVKAIRSGRLRHPDRLGGFVRSVVRFQVATQIGLIVAERRRRVCLETGAMLADSQDNPEELAWKRQRGEIAAAALGRLRPKDREILVRFYLKEQPEEVICQSMKLTGTQYRLLKSRAKARLRHFGRREKGVRPPCPDPQVPAFPCG